MPTILLKKSDTPGSVPGTANLTNLAGGAEVAVNTADKRMFSMTSASAVIELGTNPSSLTCADASFTVARVGSLTISSLSLTNATVTSATVTTLTGTSANITTVTGTTAGFSSANITQLQSTSATITTLTSTSANITTVSGTTATYTSATITNLNATSFTLSNLSIASANITTLTSTNATAASLTVSTGNLTFSSTAQRITGDMSNATASSRLAMQTNTVNGNTGIYVLPNGTSTTAGILVSNNSVPDNSAVGFFQINSAEVRLISGISGTGTYLPITFYTNNSERMRLDTSGNLGIGTASPTSKLHVYQTGSASTMALIYNNTNAAELKVQTNANDAAFISFYTNGNRNWSVGPGQTTANLFEIRDLTASATRMGIDSSGNVGIGTASPVVKLQSAGTSGSAQFRAGTASNGYFEVNAFDSNPVYCVVGGSNATAGVFGTQSNIPSIFFTNNTERMRISSDGSVGIGTTSAGGFNGTVNLGGSGSPTSGFLEGWGNAQSIPSSVTTRFDGFFSVATTAAASFTLPELRHFTAQGNTKGAGSTVTSQFGFYADSNLTTATNNFGFYSDIASGSNRWNFYAAGTAQNYFAGDTGVGTTPLANVRLGVLSAGTTSGTYAILARNSSSTDLFSVRSDGLFQTGTNTESPANKTTATAANVVVDTGTGALQRSTSSLRYKTNVVDATHGLADVLKLRSVTYKGKNDGDKVFGGLIAEEVHDAGLTEFVAYDKEGRPDALHYGNMVALLVKAVQELKAELEALKAA